MTKFVLAIAVRNANSKYAKVYVGDFRHAPLMEESYIERCLRSAQQDYPYYRVVIRDDASTDGTWEVIQAFVRSSSVLVDARQNPTRLGVIENHYQMAQVIDDDEVIVVLDGDDELVGSNVLTRVAKEYANPDVWLTYGSYENNKQCRDPRPEIDPRGHVREMLPHCHQRTGPFLASHLRTYKRWLFDRIRLADLVRGTQHFPLIPDLVLMWPMVEMAGPQHCRYIDDILYSYNAANPYNIFKGPGAWPKDTPAHERIQEEGARAYGHEHILVREEIDTLVEYFCKQQTYPRLAKEKASPWK